MANIGTQLTEKELNLIANRLQKIYREAQRDLKAKAKEHTAKYKAKDAEKRAAVQAGKLTKEEYKRWQQGQVFIGKQWKSKVEQMAQGLVNIEKTAVEIVRDGQMQAFADNANHTEYSIDQDSGFGMNFGLFDTRTVAKLVKEQPELLRRRYVDGKACKAWNVRIIANCVTQGILQGESVQKIADRMARDTASTDMKAMLRYARTAMTGAQNAGRQYAMEESVKQGIAVKKVWLATLDDRTRDAHADLDGQVVDVDKPFSSELGPIMYPGDPNAADANVWNCRCALGYEYPDSASVGKRYDQEHGEVLDEDMTYAEWKRWRSGGGGAEAVTREDKTTDFVRMVEYGELFPAGAKEVTEKVLKRLHEEFPLKFGLDYVGDVRTHRDIGLEDDALDLHYNHKELVPCAAQYLPDGNGVGNGRACIEIHKENMGLGTLREEFQMRADLRKRQGISEGEIPSKSHAFYTASDTLEGTIMHEYGHALADSWGVFRAGRENPYKDWEWRFWETHKEELMALSLYSVSHPDEMFAEAFVKYHDVEHKDTLAYELAAEIIETFIRYTKDGDV